MKIQLEFDSLEEMDRFCLNAAVNLSNREEPNVRGGKQAEQEDQNYIEHVKYSKRAKKSKRVGKLKRRWSDMEDKFLVGEAANKRTNKWLAKRLGRSAESVSKRLRRLVGDGQLIQHT